MAHEIVHGIQLRLIGTEGLAALGRQGDVLGWFVEGTATAVEASVLRGVDGPLGHFVPPRLRPKDWSLPLWDAGGPADVALRVQAYLAFQFFGNLAPGSLRATMDRLWQHASVQALGAGGPLLAVDAILRAAGLGSLPDKYVEVVRRFARPTGSASGGRHLNGAVVVELDQGPDDGSLDDPDGRDDFHDVFAHAQFNTGLVPLTCQVVEFRVPPNREDIEWHDMTFKFRGDVEFVRVFAFFNGRELRLPRLSRIDPGDPADGPVELFWQWRQDFLLEHQLSQRRDDRMVVMVVNTDIGGTDRDAILEREVLWGWSAYAGV